MKDRKDIVHNFKVPSHGAIMLDSSSGDGENKEVPSDIQICKTGVYYCRFPWDDDLELPITVDDFRNMVANFNANILKNKIFIDYDHYREENAGTIKKVYLKNNDTELWAVVEWNNKGRESILDKQYVYISAEFNFNHKDNETRNEYGPTLYGAALTNRPFIRGMAPVIELSETKTFNNQNPKQPKQGKKKMDEKQVKEMLEGVTNSFKEQFGQVLSKVEELSSKINERDQKDAQVAELSAKEIESQKREAKFNVLLSEGKVVPAQKEAFISGDVEKMFELAQDVNLSTKGHGQTPSAPSKESEKEFSDRIHKLSVELSKKDGITYLDAQRKVLKDESNMSKWKENFSLKAE